MLPDGSKIIRVTPVFKGSVFLCFSKILDRITFNRFPKYLRVSEVFNPRSLIFQIDHSTGHSIIQLVIK